MNMPTCRPSYSNVKKSGNTGFFSITFERFRVKSWNSACSIMILKANFPQSFTSMALFYDAWRPLLRILSVKKSTDFHEIGLNMWFWRTFWDMTYFSLAYHFVNLKWILLLFHIQMWNSFNFNNFTKSFNQNDILTRDPSVFNFWHEKTVFWTLQLHRIMP